MTAVRAAFISVSSAAVNARISIRPQAKKSSAWYSCRFLSGGTSGMNMKRAAASATWCPRIVGSSVRTRAINANPRREIAARPASMRSPALHFDLCPPFRMISLTSRSRNPRTGTLVRSRTRIEIA